jgi:hypothetical protein
MRYLILGRGWSCGGDAQFLPPGTEVDTSLVEFTQFAMQPPPPGAQALDQAAYDVLAQLYPANVIMSGPDINRWKDPLG